MRVRFPLMKSFSTGESHSHVQFHGLEMVLIQFCFSSRFFKKRHQDKLSRRPRRNGDDESVEDVDDDEFEKFLGELSLDVF